MASFLKEQVTETANNRGNRQGTLSNDLYFWWDRTDRVDFTEYTNRPEDEENCIRVMSITSEGCNIQYRAHTAIGKNGMPNKTAKKKNLSACAFLSKQDLLLILERMEANSL